MFFSQCWINERLFETHLDLTLMFIPAEHYVFPEDQPAEDRHEVKTVEEESLFRVAFPEMVEGYLRDKALAQENKTKSKKVFHFKSINYIKIRY